MWSPKARLRVSHDLDFRIIPLQPRNQGSESDHSWLRGYVTPLWHRILKMLRSGSYPDGYVASQGSPLVSGGNPPL